MRQQRHEKKNDLCFYDGQQFGQKKNNRYHMGYRAGRKEVRYFWLFGTFAEKNRVGIRVGIYLMGIPAANTAESTIESSSGCG